MKLKRILLQNIRSYDIAEIEFPDGNVLLSGDIGSGKSSVLLAIEFALFGLQRGVGGGILLRNGQKIGGVKLEFEIDGKNVKIERKLKRVKESVKQDLCFIEVDGLKEQLSSTELKSRILDLLKYPQEFLNKNAILYKYTVYTPQEEMKSILTEDSSLRLNTLRRVFGIDRYKRIIENSIIVNTRLREQIKHKEGMVIDLEDKRTELQSRKNERGKVRTEIVDLRTKLEDANKVVIGKKKNLDDVEVKLKDVVKIKTELASVLAELKMKKEQEENNSSEVELMGKRLIDSEKRINESQIDLKDVDAISRELKRKEEELIIADKKFLELARLIAGDETNKARLLRVVSSVTSLDNCPTCKQKVGPDHKHGIKSESESEISKINESMKTNLKEKGEIEIKKKEIITAINELRIKDRSMLTIKSEIKVLEENKQTLIRMEATKKQIEEKLIVLNSQKDELEKKQSSFLYLDTKYAEIKQELSLLQEKQKSVEINNAKTERRLEDLETAIIKFADEIEKKQKIKSSITQLKKAKEWLTSDFVKIIEEIEKSVMGKVHSEFSSLFGKWFSVLADGLNARINEEFTPVIEQQGYEIDYAFLSGGERTAAALAYRLALNQVINGLMSNIKTKDLLILDEPTEGFSSEQLDKMRNVLQELKLKQLILVSHESKIESFVDKIIRFHKDEVTRIL